MTNIMDLSVKNLHELSTVYNNWQKLYFFVHLTLHIVHTLKFQNAS